MSRARFFVVSLLMLAAGCAAPRGSQVVGYYGPTDSLPKLVESINANATQIPTLRGSGNFEAWIQDNGKTRYVNGQVTLLYAQPNNFRLIGKKDIAGSIFELGSNADRYWVILRGDADAMWTGRYENINHINADQIPIRPDLLLEVLGIQPIPSDLLAQPAPTLRFNNDADAYMIVWNTLLNDRWAAQKEIWYDRQTKLPKLVLLFDQNGRIVLRAYLANHRAVGGDHGPMVATNYRVFFPDTGSKMTIDLGDDIALHRNNAPNDHSFIFPGDRAGVSRTIDLDAPTAQ